MKLPDETEWVEFKCNNKDPERIARYISGLSNAAALCERPNAYIVWGVADDSHRIVGTDFEYRKVRRGNEELEAWLTRMINPKIGFAFYEVFMEDGKKVTLLEIPCAEKETVKYGSAAMIRIGSNLKSLVEYSDNQFTKTVLFAKIPFDMITKEDRIRTCYMQACLAYVEFSAISNSDIRELFDLEEKDKVKASRIIKDTVAAGLIKPLDPGTAPRYMKYIPAWA